MDLNSEFKKSLKEKIIFDKYQIIKKIEKNKNLQIYKGRNIISNELILIKIEQKKEKKRKGILERESYYLNYLKSQGIPTIKKIGYFGNNIVSIQPLLGPTLSHLFIKNLGNFKIKDVAMISIQILERIKYIHNKNIIHCDINPYKFALGLGRFQNIIYMTDFNSAKRYRDRNTLEHIKYKLSNTYEGNFIFASVNALRGVELSRRDDLESLGYMLIYFLKGDLPWEHIKSSNNSEKRRKIYQIKKYYNLSELCEGIPEEFKLFLNYVKSLNFKEEPDYNYCFSLFYGIFKKMKIINDGIFSWYQEKNKEKINIVNKFYNKLWFNKFFNGNTSTTSIFNEYNKEKNNIINTDNNAENIKRVNSCFLNVHNTVNYILNDNYNNSSKININNSKEIKNKYFYPIKKNDKIKIIDGLKTIEIEKINPNINIQNSEEKNNKETLSSGKEYSIEGKLEQEVVKIKAYEKKQIGKNIKKNFNKIKNENNKIEINKNDLMQIKKRINNKKSKDETFSFNNTNTNNNFNSIDKTFSNKELNKKNLSCQIDIINNDYLKKSFPCIKSGNLSTKNNYIKNRIKFLRNKDNCEFTSYSHINNDSKTMIKNNNSINNNFNSIIGSYTNAIENQDLSGEPNNSRKKQKKKISLNLDNIFLNTQRLNNISNKSIIKQINENSKKKIKAVRNSYQNSLSNLSNRNFDRKKPEIIKVIKNNMLNKPNKPDYINNNINNSKPKDTNIYEHKSLIKKYLNTNTFKKDSGKLNDNSNRNICNTIYNSNYNTNYNSNSNIKKNIGKTFKKIPFEKLKSSNSFKKHKISRNKNSELNKRIFNSSSFGKKTANNNIENEINNTEQNIYKTFIRNNAIFSNLNTIINRNNKQRKYIYTRTKKTKNNEGSTKKKNSEKKGIFKKFVNIANSPIIHNSISKVNLIQNVSNIYVTKSYLEEKPLTERKNKVLVSHIKKNRNIYIKPKNKISQEWSLVNKEKINDFLLNWNNKIKTKNVEENNGKKNAHNYFYSEFNIFKEN